MIAEQDPALAQLARIDDPIDRQCAVRAYLSAENGEQRGVPSLYNADVLELAAMWDRALAATGTVWPAWHALRWKIGQRVAGKDAWGMYADAAGFWHVTDRLAVRLRSPTTCTRNGATVTQSGDRVQVTGSTDYVDMWIALKKHFNDQRGYDLVGKTRIPRTTNADVIQLAQIWDQAAASARTDIFGVKGAQAAWRAISEEVAQATEGADPTATYEDNLSFWRVSNKLATRVQVATEEPPDVDLVDALSSNIQKLPDRLKAVGEWMVDEVKGAADGAADAAGDAAAGVGNTIARGLGPIIKPLAIGAGVLGGAIVVSKLIEKRRARRAG